MNIDLFENQEKIAIIGLGYVGLPLAVEFSKVRPVVAFDINKRRVRELRDGTDSTGELDEHSISLLPKLEITDSVTSLKGIRTFIVTVPTPIDQAKQPDLTPLLNASKLIASVISIGSTVIFESTVYPGVTEEVCAPEIEKISGLKFNQDFFCGYSPERVNPGDKSRRLPDIVKITSGSTPETAIFVDNLYKEIISAGTKLVTSIKVAEAAKVIENTQRDINIALMNELSSIFTYLNIDTEEVLQAAGTKWNFLPFRPGLVGGHCIGVDPYYLTYKAQSIGYNPEMILAGRRINDSMPSQVIQRFVKLLFSKANCNSKTKKVLMMGFAFKENCPDTRNTKIFDMVRELKEYGIIVDVFDPVVDHLEVKTFYEIDLIENPKNHSYDGVILAVPHNQFVTMEIDEIRQWFVSENTVFADLKAVFKFEESDMRL